MKIASLSVAVIFVVLFEFPSGSAGPCGCSCQKELPARQCGENDVTYYKRIFPVKCSCECSIKKLYESVFYQYKGETNDGYVKRIDTIFGNVYSDLDCRYNVQKQSYLEKYYQYKYVKKCNENDEAFFQRVLTKRNECDCAYKSRVELMKTFVKQVDWSKIKLDLSVGSGFSIVKKAAGVIGGICGCQQAKKKNAEKKGGRGQTKANTGSCGCQNKNNEKQKEIEERRQSNERNKEKIKQDQQNHCNNENEINQRNKEHCKNVANIQNQKDTHDDNVKKIGQYNDEHGKNVEKANDQKCEHDRNVKEAEAQNAQHDKNVEKIEAQNAEHDNNVEKIKAQNAEHDNNVQKIEDQKAEHDKNVEKIEAQNAQHDQNVAKIDERQKQHEENVRKWVKANYCKKCDEDVETYYKRICTKSSSDDNEYVLTMNAARSSFPTLDLWTQEKYLVYTQTYYTCAYSKKQTETEKDYYKRLTAKDCFETDKGWAQRVHLFHIIWPSLNIWYEEKHYECYTKRFYQIYYEKEETETNEVYLKRIFTKIVGESEENFWKRMKLIQKTFPDYKCWYEKENLQKLDVCKSISGAKSADDLKVKVESGKQTDGCRQAKLECLQTFFKSSKKSQASQSSSEEEESYTSKTC